MPYLMFAPQSFVETLPYMGKGMLGILLVMGAIIAVTLLLNRITRPKK